MADLSDMQMGELPHPRRQSMNPEEIARRKEIMRLMREDFDPRPNSGLPLGEWDDNAEEVADKIEALIASALSTERTAREKAERERDRARRLLWTEEGLAAERTAREKAEAHEAAAYERQLELLARAEKAEAERDAAREAALREAAEVAQRTPTPQVELGQSLLLKSAIADAILSLIPNQEGET